MSFDGSRLSQERFGALVAALDDEAAGEIRCPGCDVAYLTEVWAGVWECQRCGRVENPESETDAACPYCGRPELTLFWEEGIIECRSCGVVDKADVRAILDR